MKKIYLVVCDVGEGVPSYTFIVRETTLKKAEKIARATLKNDYPDNWEYNKNDYSIREVTMEQLVADLTIN